MLTHPTRDKLLAMRFLGMVAALDDQQNTVGLCDHMSFEERLGLLVDREMTDRNNRQLTQRLKRARLRQNATAEDIDYQAVRGLDRSLVAALLSCEWIRRHDNCLITGPTGAGKSYVACALANKACRDGFKVQYVRSSRLFAELSIARADGSYGRRLLALSRTDLLVIDDWGQAALAPDQARDLLEILDDRYENRSTLIASQAPVDTWHGLIGDPTLADAALDRLIHNAHRIGLTGESQRKRRAAALTRPATTEP